MKSLCSFFLVILIGISALFAEDGSPLPDLSEAFPTEKLFNETRLEGLETYAYATDLQFADLKKKFSEFLGEEWTETKDAPEVEKSISEAMKAQGTALEGVSFFSNSAFPTVQIWLMQMKLELEGKKFIANAAVRRSTGERATRSDLDVEGSDAPKQKSEEHSN